MSGIDKGLIIHNGPVDSVGGAKPEPEQRPVDHVVGLPTDVRTKEIETGVTGQIQANIQSEVVFKSDAETMANAARMCGACIHFDPLGFRELLPKLKAAGYTETLDKLRTMFIDTGAITIDDVMQNKADQAMMSVAGLCKAWAHTDPEGWVGVTRMGGCPDEIDGVSVAPLFSPIDAETERRINQYRDDLLFTAAGKR